MEDFVVFDSVSKSYKVGDLEIAAVNDVSFSIAIGEFTVIVGASGAGKTTVLSGSPAAKAVVDIAKIAVRLKTAAQ